MSTAPSTATPLIGLGMTSLVLGTIALILAFFPVLGITISSCGLLAGISGLVIGRRAGGNPRWCLAGLAVSVLALGLNLALAYAPGGLATRGSNPPHIWQSPPDRPENPPPER
jgi:hypothetical protein